MKVLKIAVIGAGAAGLCAARHIAARPNFIPVVYEQSSSVGGAWNYTEETKIDKFGLKVHSAMYKNLKTNLPKQVMEFPDFPFGKELPSFMTHEQVQEYLELYCDHFKLRKYVQLETLVEHVKPISTSDGETWQVTVKNLNENTSSTSSFDAVFVCNGHYAKPNIPDIPGLEHFKGLMLHSHSYRHPEDFAGKNVVLLGARSSGQDIALDIAKHAKKVVLSHRTDRLASALPENMSQAPTVVEILSDGKTVVFDNGSQTEADGFVFCTGYEYEFPFLDKSCDITVKDGRVEYLYNHVINPHHSSLIFIGICARVCPFPQFHYQVIYGLATLDGTFSLPSTKELLQEVEEEYQARLKEGKPHRATHVLGGQQWEYNNMLADVAKVSKLNFRVEKLYKDVTKSRASFLMHYKEDEINVLENGNYSLLHTEHS